MGYEKLPPAGKLKTGPIRDLLAKLNEARNGGQYWTTSILADRLGLPFTVTRGRLEALEAKGMVDSELAGGVKVWQGNETGAGYL